MPFFREPDVPIGRMGKGGGMGDKPSPGRPFAPSERPAGVRVCDLH